jgi:hypothetical protein
LFLRTRIEFLSVLGKVQVFFVDRQTIAGSWGRAKKELTQRAQRSEHRGHRDEEGVRQFVVETAATLLGSGRGGFYWFDVELQAFDFQDADGLAFGDWVRGNGAPEFAVDADHAFGAGLDL